MRAAGFLKRKVRAAGFLKRKVRAAGFWQKSQNANFTQKFVQFRGDRIFKKLYTKKKKPTYIILCKTIFLWVLYFRQVGGPDEKIQKQPLGWIFFKSV